MNRMEKVFAEKKANGEKVNVLYFPIGDSIFDDSIEWAKKYFKNGCTVLEVGLPFENPVLDGPTVADSMARALEKYNLDDVFEMLKEIRKQNPDNIIQPMTYYGNVEKYGVEGFALKCHEADVDAVLCPNATVEQRKQLDEALGKYDIINLRFKPYFLSDEDVKDCAENARGYIFSQAVNGGTGAQATVDPHIKENIEILTNAKVKALIVPGFGISNAEQAKEVIDMGADGFVIGSATIKHVQAGDGEAFISSVYEVCKK